MQTTRWRRFRSLFPALTTVAALLGGVACKDVNEDGATPSEGGSDSFSTEEPDLSGTLYVLTDDANQLLSILPSGMSKVLTTFPNQIQWAGQRILVVDPVARRLVVLRHDSEHAMNELWTNLTVIDQDTGAVISDVYTQREWLGLGRAETSGHIIGLVSGVPAGVAFSVATLDAATGEPTVLASQASALSAQGGMTFDGGTFFGSSDLIDPHSGANMFVLTSTPAGQQTLHPFPVATVGGSGFVFDSSRHRLLATTSPRILLEAFDVYSGDSTKLAKLPPELDWNWTAVQDAPSHRYFTIAGDSTHPSIEVLTIDTTTGGFARRPLVGPIPGHFESMVFAP